MIGHHGRNCSCPVCVCGRKLGHVINHAIDAGIARVTGAPWHPPRAGTPGHPLDCFCPTCVALDEEVDKARHRTGEVVFTVAQAVQPSSLMPMTVRDVECVGGPRCGEKLAVQDGQTVVRVLLSAERDRATGYATARTGTYAYDAARDRLVWQGEA